MAINIPYNDDVELTPINANTPNTNSAVNDTSTHGSGSSVDPITVIDNSNRTGDNWIKNNTATAGSAGETYTDTAPTEKYPLPPPVYKTIIRKTREIINDYSASYLQQLHDEGVKFYVVYTDGTEDEVEYTEIYNPRQITVGTYVNEAQAIAEATEQHFWHDNNGAHVTDIEQDDWKTAANANFNDLSDSKPYHNILMNSLGILLRRALYNLVSISKGAIAFYDGLGNEAANIVAAFGRNGVQIGASDRKHLYMDENGVAVYNADGSLATFNAQNIQTDHIAIGSIQNSISDIATIRLNSQKVNDLSKSEIESTLSENRYIYISKASGTQGVSKPADKVTETGDVQNTWTLKRPTYDSNYPVLFVSIQSVTAKGTVVFTVPAKDDTLTVIDGGHITTGIIDASRIAVDQISVGSLRDGADYVTKALAMNGFQQVYISKSANTTEMSAPTTWIVADGNVQNTWTTTRPSYDANYPKIFTSRQTRTANGTVSSSTPTLDTSTTDAISTANNNTTNVVSWLESNIASTYAAKTDAVEEVQIIYISKDSSTSSVSANTTWVTANTDAYNTWTTVRPSYNSSYPKVFMAKQTKKNDGTITCTTPTLDTSTTDAISTAASDATTKANNAKTEAISAAASDATTKANAVNTALESYKTTTNTTLTNLQNQVDGQIEAWYKNVDPTTSNDPASSWNTDVLKARHVGDLYYNISNGHSWRWMQSGSSYTWQQIPDSDAAAALSVAQNAQNIANSKRRIFTTTPTVPYDVGDLWVSGSEVKYCSTSKTSQQTYASSDWTVTATDDTLAQAAKSVADAAATPTDVATAKTEAISAAATNASITYATKADAVEQVQDIYISKPNSTSSVSANTTWVTSTTDTYDTWTTTRPSYNSSYPKVFTAKQTKKNDGTVSCTTPTLDTSTTDAISAAAADATTKANAAARTATDYITVIDNDGIKVHASNNPDTNYSRIDADGLNVIKNSISVAKFGETARVGKLLKGYIEIGTNSNNNGYIDMYNADVLLCHIGCDTGTNVNGGTSLAPYYNLGLRKPDTTIGNYSLIEGSNTTASGYASHAEGYATTASGTDSHAEGYVTTASRTASHAEGYLTTASGTDSHAEGGSTIASATDSHAEGYATTASGYASHSEGESTTASGDYSHAEGGSTTASGDYSHAEGYDTTASGYASHASGIGTTAYSQQFVCGKYNSKITTDLFEVGNGSGTSSKANAFRVTTSNTAYMGSTAVTSDRRIKTDLGKLNSSQAVNFIKSLIPRKYEKFGRKELGFFAQDVEKDPNYGDILVEQYEDHGYEDFRSLSYDGLIAPIVSVEQNLIERIEQLEKENSELKLQNESLNKRLSAIEEKLGIKTQ